jgi:hypothetical protein
MYPTILVQFDPETLQPVEIFLNGETNEVTARLRVIVDRMIEAIRERSRNAEV